MSIFELMAKKKKNESATDHELRRMRYTPLLKQAMDSIKLPKIKPQSGKADHYCVRCFKVNQPDNHKCI